MKALVRSSISIWALIALGFTLAVVAPQTAGAESGSAPDPSQAKAKTHAFTMRSHRFPETRMFTIMQFGALGATSEPYYGAKDPKLTVDLGAMRNLDKRWAVGANFRVESDETDDATGFMLRGRRWLGKDASIDIATGILKHGSNGPPLENSWVNQAQLNLGNVGSITVEMQRYKLNGMDYGMNGTYGMQKDSGTMWLVGGSFHYLFGLAAYVGLGALVAATWD